MKTAVKMILLCMVSAVFACGCSQSREIENQAYAIVMGLDRSEAGIEVSVKIPNISSSAEKDSGSGGDSYSQFLAEGANFSAALEKLHWRAPRNLNLSHLELLVISSELAASNGFQSLIRELAQTERLYAASYTLICSGRASEYVNALKPAIGSRLSLDIPARFDHLSEQGLIPEGRLADLYYLTESVYADPMVAASIEPDAQAPGEMLGAAVFANGQYAMEMDARECILANLLRNEVRYFRYGVDGRTIEAAPSRPAKLSVSLDSDPVRIGVKLNLSIGPQEDLPDISRIRTKISRDLADLIARAQAAGADPFGFSEAAARKFSTLASWQAYDWKAAYSSAETEIEIAIRRRNT